MVSDVYHVCYVEQQRRELKKKETCFPEVRQQHPVGRLHIQISEDDFGDLRPLNSSERVPQNRVR